MSYDPAKRRAKYLRYRETLLARKRARYTGSSAEQREAALKYYWANADARREYQREYERRVQGWAKRYAREKGTRTGPIDFDAVLSRAEGLCGICSKPLGAEPMHFDHIVPLSRGGAHVESNLQAAHAFCNRRKGNRVAA